MSKKNYYEILSVDPQADIDTIKRAYRQLMRENHPDKFAAEHARLRRHGTPSALKALEKKMDSAKVQVQRANEAYAVLISETKRKDYDQKLSDDRMKVYNAEIRRQRSREPEMQRRTVKSRPHRRPKAPPPKYGAVPWILLVFLMIVSLTLFSQLTRALTGGFNNSRHVPSRPTAEGIISMADLQVTQDVINATYVARTRTANDPTVTPLSAEQYVRTADRLLQRGSVNSAINAYEQAIEADPHDAEIYFKRGQAYMVLFDEGDADAGLLALSDFSQTLNLDSTFSAAHRELGLVYFTLWQTSGDINLAHPALHQLETYVSAVDEPDNEILLALSALRQAIVDN